MSAARYACVLLLFSLQRLLELLYSERNERRIVVRQRDAPQAGRSVWPLIAAVNLGLFTMPAIERAWRRRPPPRAVATIGWVTALSGLALRISAIASLGQWWNVRAIVPGHLDVVDRGPYRFIRHPNYVALALEFLGLPLIGGAYASAIVLSAANGVLLSRRITEEEALLMANPAYRARMAGKPRFIPRLVSAR